MPEDPGVAVALQAMSYYHEDQRGRTPHYKVAYS